MIGLYKKLFAIGTVSAALAMLGMAIFLIQKNSPKVQDTTLRFSPPTLPGTRSVSVAGNRSVSRKEETDLGSDAGQTENADSTRYIGGIGLVEPAGEAIAIGSQVSGIVTAVLVQPGQQVKTGEALFVIEDRSARANVKVAQANLFAQQAKLQELLGQIAPSKARVDSAAAMLEQSKASHLNALQELARAEKVRGNGLSFEELELRKLNASLTQARILEAEAKLREAQASYDLLAGSKGAPTILVQEAVVEQARASVAKEEVELSLRTMVAPKDSTVLQIKIRAGEFAPAAVSSTPLMTLGVVDPLHVRVDIDESEIPRFHPTAQALASVRGRPEIKVRMQYVRTEPYVVPKKTLSGGVSERVDTRVMQIIYSISPTILVAIPGQQVDVYIAEHVD
jgi:HlyD family secretion protein